MSMEFKVACVIMNLTFYVIIMYHSFKVCLLFWRPLHCLLHSSSESSIFNFFLLISELQKLHYWNQFVTQYITYLNILGTLSKTLTSLTMKTNSLKALPIYSSKWCIVLQIVFLYSWWRPQCRLKAPLFISLLHLYSPAMSTGSSQVGAVFSPPC